MYFVHAVCVKGFVYLFNAVVHMCVYLKCIFMKVSIHKHNIMGNIYLQLVRKSRYLLCVSTVCVPMVSPVEI